MATGSRIPEDEPHPWARTAIESTAGDLPVASVDVALEERDFSVGFYLFGTRMSLAKYGVSRSPGREGRHPEWVLTGAKRDDKQDSKGPR